jgi:ribonuclease HI
MYSPVSFDASNSGPQAGARLILHTDGAARGNPGPAAAGIVVERTNGDVLVQTGTYLGEMPNNQAEYRALILGLRAASEFHPAAVDVFMDSELVVRQMTGVYQVRDATLRQLYQEAMTLARAIPLVSFTHVRRAQNAVADRLANQALNQQQRLPRQPNE